MTCHWLEARIVYCRTVGRLWRFSVEFAGVSSLLYWILIWFSQAIRRRVCVAARCRKSNNKRSSKLRLFFIIRITCYFTWATETAFNFKNCTWIDVKWQVYPCRWNVHTSMNFWTTGLCFWNGYIFNLNRYLCHWSHTNVNRMDFFDYYRDLASQRSDCKWSEKSGLTIYATREEQICGESFSLNFWWIEGSTV